MHSQLVVLGGGPGGYAAAFLAADEGLEVTLIEAEGRLGGAVAPLQLELPVLPVAAQPRGGVLRRQPPAQVHQARRGAAGHLPRPVAAAGGQAR